MKKIAPTKSNLMKTRDELKFAKLGFDLLDQKRSILVSELVNLTERAETQQRSLETTLAEAYKSLENAVLRMGKLKIHSLSAAVHIESEIRLASRKVMGVGLPIVDTDFHEKAPYFSMTDTPYYIDEAVSRFKTAVESMGQFAEIKISIMRLAREVKKTIRKVNALEKIAIPDLEETVRHIANRLEEAERENLILMKTIKERLEKAGEEEE